MVLKLPPGSYFGRTQNRRVIGGIVVSESVYRPDYCVPPHEHAAAFFDFVVEGACSEVFASRRRDRGRSTLAFHPAGELHSSRWHGPRPCCFHVEIAPALFERVRQYCPILDSPVGFAEGTPSLLGLRLYREFRRMDEVSPLAIEGLTLELLVAYARHAAGIPERSPPRWLAQLRDLLHARFSEQLTLASMADAIGIHPAHLARTFRRFQGCTVADYIRKLRIEFACRCLVASDASLAEIALATGFCDQSHFSKTFKREMSMTPAGFKKAFDTRKSETIARS